MNLLQLEPEWLKFEDRGSYRRLEDNQMAEADGVLFLCPVCWQKWQQDRSLGCHSIVCWFVGKVPDDVSPSPGRWIPVGTGFSDLTFRNAPNVGESVWLQGVGCGAHFRIVQGRIEFA